MKLNATFIAMGLVLATSSLAAQKNDQKNDQKHDQKTLMCELKDLSSGRMIDRGSDTLDNRHILFLMGGADIMGTVRDVVQVTGDDRNLQLHLSYRSGVESSQSHAETTYLAESVPLNTTLAETTIELGHSERRYQLRCFLQ
ncbi:MAG: hypothetical protein ACJ763_19690 [Bdellovibrionia bacterium]